MTLSLRKKVILIGSVVLLVVVAVFFMSNRGDNSGLEQEPEIVNAGDPVDPTMEFYNRWLDAVKSTTTNPIGAGLANDEFLSESVREYITVAQGDAERTLDPVLCQTITPERLGVKVSYQHDTKSQLLIIARGMEEKSSEMAVVDLVAQNGKWQISNISCSFGETGPNREFSFEREGFMLKSVPPPLNPDYWHIVFEENGQSGHTSPLFFSDSSVCLSIDGIETVCDETQFKDATKVLIQGEMTEAGVEVKKVNFMVK